MLYFLIYVLFIHYLADFVCQTNWMALNKSKNNLALGVHVITYSAVMLLGLHIALIFHVMSYIWLFVLANGLLHFATDYISSRLSAKFLIAEQRSYFWWTIGGDQWVHQATLIILTALLLSH